MIKALKRTPLAVTFSLRDIILSLAGSVLFLSLPTSYAVAQQAQLTHLNDLSFGTWSGSGDLTQNDSVCVYLSTGSSYTIEGSGSGGGGAFVVSGPSGSLSYELRWKHGAGSFVQLSPNTPSSFSGASNTINCGGGQNAMFEVTFPAANLSTAHADFYSGSLTLLLTPN